MVVYPDGLRPFPAADSGTASPAGCILVSGCFGGGNTALDIQNGDCAEVHHITFEDIRVEYNSFDTPEVYQRTNEMVYEPKNVQHVPFLIKISNHRFRSQHALEVYGLPLELSTPLELSDIQSTCVHDITYKNIHIYYDEAIAMKDSKFNVPVSVKSHFDDVEYYNIDVSDVTLSTTKGGRITGEAIALDIEL